MFCILQATDQRRNSTHKNMTGISHMIEQHLCKEKWFSGQDKKSGRNFRPGSEIL